MAFIPAFTITRITGIRLPAWKSALQYFSQTRVSLEQPGYNRREVKKSEVVRKAIIPLVLRIRKNIFFFFYSSVNPVTCRTACLLKPRVDVWIVWFLACSCALKKHTKPLQVVICSLTCNQNRPPTWNYEDKIFNPEWRQDNYVRTLHSQGQH